MRLGRGSPQGRPDRARHRQPAWWHRQGRARRRVRIRPRSRRGPSGRRRHRGCGRPRRTCRGWLRRLRRRHRDPGHHGSRRQGGPRARSAQAHAEPQDRHRHQRHRPDRRRVQGRQGGVPHRQGRQHPRADRQGQLRAEGAARELPRRASTRCSGPSRRRQRASTSSRSPCLRRWVPACASTPTASRSPRKSSPRKRRTAGCATVCHGERGNGGGLGR